MMQSAGENNKVEVLAMKRFSIVLALILMVSVLCAGTVGAGPIIGATPYHYSENFNTLNLGMIVGQDGWVADNSGNASIVEEAGQGRVLKIERPASSTAGARKSIANIVPGDGYATIECDFKIIEGTTESNTQILNLLDGGTQIVNVVYRPASKTITANFQGNTVMINENAWNRLKLIVDLTAGNGGKAKVTAYLNGVEIANAVDGTNNMSGDAKLSNISFVQNLNCDAQIFFNNIKVYKGKWDLSIQKDNADISSISDIANGNSITAKLKVDGTADICNGVLILAVYHNDKLTAIQTKNLDNFGGLDQTILTDPFTVTSNDGLRVKAYLWADFETLIPFDIYTKQY